MNEDRERLNELLANRGYHARGDLILVRPKWSETRKVHEAEKAVVAVMSADVGESFAQDGMRLERFRKNPVVLWHHAYDGLPVAHSLWERVRMKESTTGHELLAKLQFHLDTEVSREAWDITKITDGVEWEIGVLPAEWDFNTGTKVLVMKWDLMQVSAVPGKKFGGWARRWIRERRISSPVILRSAGELDDDPGGEDAPDHEEPSDEEGPYRHHWKRRNGFGSGWFVSGPGFTERFVAGEYAAKRLANELNAAWRLGRNEAAGTTERPYAENIEARITVLEEWRREMENGSRARGS